MCEKISGTAEETYRGLLLQKKELVFRLLRLTNDAALADESPENNAESYIGLVEAREEIINQLKELDGSLEGAAPPGMAEESASINREIKEMANQIARLELDVNKKALGIMTHFRREIGIVNNQKKDSGYKPGMLYESKA